MTLRDLVHRLELMPPGASVPRDWIDDELEQVVPPGDAPPELHQLELIPFADLSWRERLWLVPAETRVGVRELAEALGRSTSWVYRRTSPKAAAKAGLKPLPHRRLEGELIFVLGEIRSWVHETEEIMSELEKLSTPAERALLRVIQGGGS